MGFGGMRGGGLSCSIEVCKRQVLQHQGVEFQLKEQAEQMHKSKKKDLRGLPINPCTNMISTSKAGVTVGGMDAGEERERDVGASEATAVVEFVFE